jgi:hypothetical protein
MTSTTLERWISDTNEDRNSMEIRSKEEERQRKIVATVIVVSLVEVALALALIFALA